jgi:hypothetical protein
MKRKKKSRQQRLTIDDVREIALSMPDVIETTAYGMAAFKAGGRRFAGQPVERPDVEPNTIGVHLSFEDRDALLASRPDVYYLTEHFAPYPAVLARLTKMRRDELRELLGASWRYAMEQHGARRKKSRKVAGLAGSVKR